MKNKIKNFQKCLENLEEVLGKEANDIYRDSAILRFELCVETAWKAVQAIAKVEGFEDVNSPRKAFQKALSLEFISNEDVWSDVLRARNLTIHTYNESVAVELYGELPKFLEAFKELGLGMEKYLK